MLESTAAAHWLEHQLLSEWPHILQLGKNTGPQSRAP